MIRAVSSNKFLKNEFPLTSDQDIVRLLNQHTSEEINLMDKIELIQGVINDRKHRNEAFLLSEPLWYSFYRF